MVVGPFVLISGLLPMLERSGDGRVITVVSGGMYGQALPLDDLEFERGDFNGTLAYARAKRAATALTREWGRRLRGRPVRVNAMHPGWADTPGLAAVAAWLPRPHGSAPADACPGHRHGHLAGRGSAGRPRWRPALS